MDQEKEKNRKKEGKRVGKSEKRYRNGKSTVRKKEKQRERIESEEKELEQGGKNKNMKEVNKRKEV
jgi:hypothetical protein